MSLYKIGKVISIGKTYIIFEVQYTGYIINVPNSESFQKDQKIKLYVYEYKTEYSNGIYGFNTFKERIMFDDLISINGVGPKTALNMLAIGFDELSNLILNEDPKTLSSIPGLGSKTASHVIFELKDKYNNFLNNKNNKVSNYKTTEDLKSTLKTLGFNKSQIEYALVNMPEIKQDVDIEMVVEEAIKIISNEKIRAS